MYHQSMLEAMQTCLTDIEKPVKEVQTLGNKVALLMEHIGTAWMEVWQIKVYLSILQIIVSVQKSREQ